MIDSAEVVPLWLLTHLSSSSGSSKLIVEARLAAQHCVKQATHRSTDRAGGDGAQVDAVTSHDQAPAAPTARNAGQHRALKSGIPGGSTHPGIPLVT
jgi:hypothetical protein